MGFQSVPDLPELLIQGKERPYLQWFYEHFAYDPSAIGASDIDVYVAAISQVGALRAGLAVYQDYFTTAEQVATHAKKPLSIPVRAFGGNWRVCRTYVDIRKGCGGGSTRRRHRAVWPLGTGGTAGLLRSADLVRELVEAGH